MGLDAIRRLGEGTNAGIWPSINGTLIWALSLIDGELAWDEWKKNSLAYHAENYPEVWYGIWSGPDTYNSNLSEYPGQTVFKAFEQSEGDEDAESKENLGHIGINWTDFPVFNLHPHAWPLFNTKHLIGINFTIDGVEIKPILPIDKYKFASPLIGFQKEKNFYSGWYAPLSEGNWKMILKIPTDELNLINTLEINGIKKPILIQNDCLIIEGKNDLHNKLEWKVSF
jgi:hypothetical protein